MTRPLPTCARMRCDRLGAERLHGPVAGGAGDGADEVAQERGAVRRVHDLGMELHRVEAARRVGDRREGRVVGDADHLEAGRQAGDAVAVAHPYGVALALAPHPLEQGRVGDHLDLGAAELAVMPRLDGAAELRRHGLLAVADAEHRHARLEDALRRARRGVARHRFRPARQDDALRLHLAKSLFGRLEGHDLRIDALLAHAPGDQLRHLRAEIDDQDLVVGLRHGGCLSDRGTPRNASRRCRTHRALRRSSAT